MSHERDDASVDAAGEHLLDSRADAPAADAIFADARVVDAAVDATVTYHAAVDVHLYSGTLFAHYCHDPPACMDGNIQFDVVNTSSASHLLTIHVITVTTTGGGPLVTYNTGFAVPSGSVTVPAGTTRSVHIPFSVYSMYASCAPGPFRIIVAFDVDGAGFPLVVDPATVSLDPEC